MFIRFDRIHERDRHTHTHRDRQLKNDNFFVHNIDWQRLLRTKKEKEHQQIAQLIGLHFPLLRAIQTL